jgi:hypothetical protein
VLDEFPNIMIATEPVVKAMKKAKISNCRYELTEDWGKHRRT